MRVLAIAVIAALVGGGAVYGALLYLGQNPVQVIVQLRQETPPLAPASPPSPIAAPPPTATGLPTAVPSTVSPTATLRPTPTVASVPAPTPIPTPAGPTEREKVVSAFAECNGRYSGEEKRRRFAATNSAIDRDLHSVATVRALVEENCGGVFPGLAATATPTEPPTLMPTSVPASAPTVPPTFDLTPAPSATPRTGVAGHGRFDGPALEKEIHELINGERVNRGVPELLWDEEIAVIARDHSEDMATNDYFRHDNLRGESPTDRGNRAGYPCHKSLGGGAFSYGLGENIWRGWEYSSYTYGAGGTQYDWMSQNQLARAAVSSWMNSTGHRENILDPQYDKTAIGVGFGTAGGKDHAVYLTQNFC